MTVDRPFPPTDIATAPEASPMSDRSSLPVELTEQQLDEVAGGLDIFLSGSFFEENTQTLLQDGGCSRPSSFGFRSSQIFTGAFQFIGLGIKTQEDAALVGSFLSGLFGGMFGRRRR
ncbi:MAG: CTB family bacteriocin [Oculatellaceae cyanobacterium Prado106]|jgi:hypothetical protein|nr:CTB family bacteriocin [Oculatellaceae cyanobacterium Prado106]